MHGIKVQAGINDCYWNVDGNCTDPETTKEKIPYYFRRDWGSRQECLFTILTKLCCPRYMCETLGMTTLKH